MLKAVAVWDDFRPDVDSRLDSELIYFNVTEYAMQSTEWPTGDRLFPEGLELDCEVLSDDSFPAFIGRLSHKVSSTLFDNDIMSQWCSDKPTRSSGNQACESVSCARRQSPPRRARTLKVVSSVAVINASRSSRIV